MKKKIIEYIKLWEERCYKNGIPDEVPQELFYLCPSYKRIAISILSNDMSLKKLGFSHPKSEIYHELKRIEIENRKNNGTKS